MSTSEIYTLSLHDALPILISLLDEFSANVAAIGVLAEADDEEDDRIVEDYISLIKIKNVNMQNHTIDVSPRSEEHTSELQSRGHLVCRLLLEKKRHN